MPGRLNPIGQRGATLIEVLVAVLVLSIGLLGLAGLQAVSLKSNQSAHYRSQATVLAGDIADRMRLNRAAALAGGYDSGSFPTSSNGNAIAGSRAQQDLAEWLNALANLLPEGTGRVETGSDDALTIAIRWDDRRGAVQQDPAVSAIETFEYRTRL